MQIRKAVILAVFTLFLAACAPGSWHVHQAWARPTPQGGTAAVYFLLHNATDTDDALIGASTDAARVVEMHENVSMSREQRHGQAVEHEHAEGHDEEDGHAHGPEADVMTMRPVSRVELAAGHEIHFQPGGYHIMLIDLQDDLNLDDSFEMTLHFEHAEDITIQVTVRE